MYREPIKHHYIPQFILKNFCFEDRRLLYCDKSTGKISVKGTKDVFMERNLYRDETNNAADPVRTEKDFAAYEQEVSQILKERFLEAREFFITPQEDAKIKLFLAIMGFRALSTAECFNTKMSKQSREFYRQYQIDGNFLAMWKRNLGYIVQCRSVEEICNHPKIDMPIKVFLMRDAFGYFGKHIAVAEASDGDAFVIGDAYPVVISGVLQNGVQLNLYDIFPISANRVIFLVTDSIGLEEMDRKVLFLRNFLFRPPKRMEEQKLLRIRVKKLSTDELQFINNEIVKNAKRGFVFCYRPRKMPQL